MTRQILDRILYYKFPVHIITKSDLVIRDFDLLERINKEAILPADLQSRLKQKVFITFSFSTLDDTVGRIFEPGAPPPHVRLGALRQALAASFHAGVSLMPLLPYITDTEECIQDMFSAFSQLKARYVFPASVTLFGNGPYDNNTLVLNAIRKHYPDLEEKYRQLFTHGFQPPTWYRNRLNKTFQRLNVQYRIPNTLLQDLL